MKKLQILGDKNVLSFWYSDSDPSFENYQWTYLENYVFFARFWTKGVCLLVSILGVTWISGIFYINQETIFFAYLFAITNSLQGLSIFIFHCMLDPRVSSPTTPFSYCYFYLFTLFRLPACIFVGTFKNFKFASMGVILFFAYLK